MTGYQMVPTDSLKPSGYNPNQLSDDDQAQLVTEIRYQGRLLKPVVCRQVDDQLIIVDGEHSWHAAREAGLAEVQVELIDVHSGASNTVNPDRTETFAEFEARRQTYVRNLSGEWHKVRLGRMFVDMLNTLVVASNRDLAAYLGITEGTVRNMILYSTAARLCAGRDDCPHEEAIARMGIRELRKLIAWLQGDADDETKTDQPTPAEPEARILARLKRAWAKATGDERSAFIIWTGLAAETETALKDAFAAGVQQGFEQGTAQRVTVTQPKPGRPRKQSTNGADTQPVLADNSSAVDEKVWRNYVGKDPRAAPVLEYLAAQPDAVRSSDIVEACGLQHQVGRKPPKPIESLKAAGYICREGYGRYRITDSGRAALAFSPEPEHEPQPSRRRSSVVYDYTKRTPDGKPTVRMAVDEDHQHPAAPAVDNSYTARGSRIRAERTAKGLTGKELAKLAGIAPNYVSMAELGRLTSSGGPAAGRPAFDKLEAALGLTAH